MNINRFSAALLLVLTGVVACADDPVSLDQETRQLCLKVLRQGLQSDEFWPAMHAAEALTLADHQQEIRQFLIPKLPQEADDQRRCGLSRELIRAGASPKLSVMMDILMDESSTGRVHAAESLYKVGWLGESEPLIEAMNHANDIRLRLMAAAAIAKHETGDKQLVAFRILRNHLGTESDPELFRLSAWVLGRIGNKTDVALIRSRIPDANTPVQVAFLQHALAALGDPDAKKILLKNLESPDPVVRTYAAVFAGESEMTEAMPLLKTQLSDENLDARIRAAQALLTLAKTP